MFRIHPTFIDILAILLAVFMLISVLMAKNLQHEYLTKVDMLKKVVENRFTDTPDTDTPSLTVILKGKDEYMFVIESKKMGKKDLISVMEVKEELAKIRPARISLRIDKDVPTGVTQELLFDAQSLGILPYLSVEKG